MPDCTPLPRPSAVHTCGICGLPLESPHVTQAGTGREGRGVNDSLLDARCATCGEREELNAAGVCFGCWQGQRASLRKCHCLTPEDERKIEAYDAARATVKREGNTRAYYVLRAEAAEAEVTRLREALERIYQCGRGPHVRMAREALDA